MQPLTELKTSLPPPKTNPKAAANWLGDLMALFPPVGADLTHERMQAMTLIFTQYPETALKEICSPLTGMATNFKFLPSLMEFKEYCDKQAISIAEHFKRVAEHERWVRYQALPPPETPQQPSQDYTGPIEDIRPGDIISWDRMEEYNTFIRTKGITPRNWGLNEVWIDSGQRPFEISVKTEPNPFE